MFFFCDFLRTKVEKSCEKTILSLETSRIESSGRNLVLCILDSNLNRIYEFTKNNFIAIACNGGSTKRDDILSTTGVRLYIVCKKWPNRKESERKEV